MAIVSNQAQLEAAVASSETEIQVGANFEMTATVQLEKTVAISSVPGTLYILTKAASFYGNLFETIDNADVTITNLILDGNKTNHDITDTRNASLLQVSSGSLTIASNVVIQNNYSYSTGGGVTISNAIGVSNHFLMADNAIIQQCEAREEGGGIYASLTRDSTFFITGNCSLLNNISKARGGGLYLSSNANETLLLMEGTTLIRGNQAQSGAGIYISPQSLELTYEIHGTLLIDNIATLDGGGLGTIESQLILTNVQFQRNQARDGAGLYHGTSYNRGQVQLAGCLFSSNIATRTGGGFFFNNLTSRAFSLTMTSTIFTKNKANDGGGIYVSGITCDWNAVTITENEAQIGGGIFQQIIHETEFHCLNSTIASNKANHNEESLGGGMRIYKGSTETSYRFDFQNTNFSDNETTGAGGALYLEEVTPNFKTTISGGAWSENKASLTGGGMHIQTLESGDMTVEDVTLENNTASETGGGLFFTNQSSATSNLELTRLISKGCLATLDGGGIYLTTLTSPLGVDLEDCTIDANKTSTGNGGGIYCDGDNNTLTLLSNTTLTDNEAEQGNGGGIFFTSENGNVFLLNTTELAHNKALQGDGGLLYLSVGTVNIDEDTKLSSNEAKQGGSVYLAPSTILNIAGGILEENQATQGGAIYNELGTIYVSAGIIQNNQADTGGAIYNE